MNQKIIKIYETPEGKKPFENWLNSIKNQKIQDRILIRLNRLESGNFGDTKYVGDDVYELRYHFDSGYRVYYGLDGEFIVLLLCGGDKSTQSKDIDKAQKYFKEYKEQKENA